MTEARTPGKESRQYMRQRQAARASRRTLAIVRAYQKGEPAIKIGRRFGVSANAIYQAVGRLRKRYEDVIRATDKGAALLETDGNRRPLGLDRLIEKFRLMSSAQTEKRK